MCNEPLFFDVASRLDELIPLAAPTLEQVEEVVELVDSEPLERYFFRHLAASGNLAWFKPLRERGYFRNSPEPIKQEGSISYPPWFALSYLTTIAPQVPEGIVGVAQALHSMSPFDFLDLVRAANEMPPEQAAQMVPVVIRWANEGMQVEASITSLAVYLAQNNEWNSALALVDLILSPQEEPTPEETEEDPLFPRSVDSRAEDYTLRTFVEQSLSLFVSERPLDVLRIIQSNLERSLRLEGVDQPDASWIWRSAIESHEQDLGRGEIKELLVDAAEYTLGIVAERMPDQARSILEEYLEHDFSIFRRLAIHTIRLNETSWPDLWERLFTDPVFLEDTDVHHEYWLLMRDTFESLPESLKERFADNLLSRLPAEPAGDRESYRRQCYQVLKLVWAIRGTLPSDKHRKIVSNLVDECGEPDYPSFHSYAYTSAGWVSSKSPKDLDQLTWKEIVSELRNPLPFHSLDEPSHEGLARALKVVIAARPQDFASMALLELFAPDIPPIHTYYALWGYREAWNEDKRFDWAPVLALCEKVSRTIDDVDTSGAPPDMLPDYWDRTYANARSSVADLLQAGVARDDHAIPSDYLSQARDILLTLADDPNPTPEYEARWAKQYPRRALDFALNVTRGRAVEALIQYALHFARINAQQQGDGQEPQSPQSRMETAVRDKLTEKVDKQVDPSLAVHSIFGKYLPNLHYLDQEWLIAHLEDIFPRQPDMAAYWEAAWEGYLFRSDFFGYLYEFLRPYYHYALDQMALAEEGKAGSELARGRLARHFAALYWRGVETLEAEDSLLPVFFDAVPDELRASFVRGLETGLAEVTPAADSEEWQRVKTLWIARVQTMTKVAERKGNLEGFLQELGAYAAWVPYVPTEEFESLFPVIEVSVRVCDSHQVHEVIEFLPSILEDHANLAMKLLELIVEQSEDRWFMATEHKAVRGVLEAAMDSDDEGTIASAVRVINRFGERGDERYRPLLDRV